MALAAAIRKREISSRDAVPRASTRMHEVNPQLNAVTVDLSEAALARPIAPMRPSSRAAKSASRSDPLHGVPVTIKENVDQEGCATVNGVAAFSDVIAAADSPVVANWKKAGAVIIGRTNTPAFSFRLDTVNDFRGRTYSPWSRAHTPGGSQRRRVVVRRRGHHAAGARQRHRGVGALSRLLHAASRVCGRRSGACPRTTRRARPSARSPRS